MPTSDRCQCGHPKKKHAKGARGGCTLRVPRRGDNGRTRYITCPCVSYQVPDGSDGPVAAETAAELIALDQQRLALDYSGPWHERLGAALDRMTLGYPEGPD